MRLVTCLCRPKNAVWRVGPRLNFVIGHRSSVYLTLSTKYGQKFYKVAPPSFLFLKSPKFWETSDQVTSKTGFFSKEEEREPWELGCVIINLGGLLNYFGFLSCFHFIFISSSDPFLKNLLP